MENSIYTNQKFSEFGNELFHPISWLQSLGKFINEENSERVMKSSLKGIKSVKNSVNSKMDEL